MAAYVMQEKSIIRCHWIGNTTACRTYGSVYMKDKGNLVGWNLT